MHKNKTLVSVVIVNYNGLSYIQQTLSRIVNLSYPNLEVVVVDDRSDDGSLNFLQQQKKIRLISNKKNEGYSKSKNKGVKAARGEYVLLLDNDILINSSNIIEQLLSINNVDKKFIQPVFRDLGENLTTHYGGFYSIYGVNWHKKMLNFKKLKNLDEYLIGYPLGGIMFFKRKNFLDLDGFDESQKFNLDDFELGMRVYLNGFQCYSVSCFDIIHLGINKTTAAKAYAIRFELMFSGKARAIIKNYSLKNVFMVFPIMLTFQFFKAIRFSIIKKNPVVLLSLFRSIKFFLENLPDTLTQRKKIQSQRKIKDDKFLSIKPPHFE